MLDAWNELSRFGFAHAVALSVQIGLLVTLVYGLSILARRGPAEVRYILWLTVALRLCWPASLESPVGLIPALDLGRAASAVDFGPWTVDGATRQSSGGRGAVVRAPALAPGAVGGDTGAVPAVSPLVVAWLAGVGILTLLFALRWRRAHRFVAACEPNRRRDLARLFDELKRDLGLRASVELRVSSEPAGLQAPAVFGLWRPVVLLPRSVVDGWQLKEIEPVLIHELVHLKRLDLPVNALQCALQAIYFFHPLVWLMNWKIREERELICDDEVVQRCGGRSDYVRSILRVVESQAAPARSAPGISMASRPSSLARRVERLLDRGYRQVERRRTAAVGAFLLGLLCVGLVSGRTEATATVRPAWTEEAEALFTLDPEENLRLVDPAAFGSRLELYRTLHPAQAAAVPAGPQRITFTWDPATRRFEPPRFSFGSDDLGLLLGVLGVESHNVAGATDWLGEPIAGDLVIRGGASLETLLGELSTVLADRHRLPLRLELREVMREVVVARGRYLPAGDQVLVGELPAEAPSRATDCPRLPVRGLDACLRTLGRLLRRPVIDEIEVTDRHRAEWLFSPVSPQDPDRLLGDLSRRTALRFDKEDRRVPVVFVVEAEPGSGG